MKNRRALIYSLVAAVLAFGFQCAYINGYEKELAAAYEPITVLVASRNIPPGVPLDDSMVSAQKIPKKYLQPKFVDNVDALFGQIAAAPILEGEQLTQTKLLSIEEAGLARKVPPGYRAIAVAVDAITGVGGHLRPGNHVDVLGTFDFGDALKHDMQAIVLFQNVEVLSVGEDLAQATPQMLNEDEGGLFGKGGGSRGGNMLAPGGKNYGNVTIALTATQVPRLILAQEVGTLNLALRKTAFMDNQEKVRIKPMNVTEALGLPQKIYRKPRPTYREIRAGGF